jgi:hypothetical protein
MSKNRAISANISAHYGYNFLETSATRVVSDSERKGIKRMKKLVRNNGSFNESRIIRIHSLEEPKVIRVVQNLLKTH